MDYEISGKIALVTGGAGGIGLCIVKELIKYGVRGISIVDNNVILGEKAAKEVGVKAIFIKTDVTKPKELEDAFKKTINKFGGLDIVANNAGIFNEKQWDKTVAVNIDAVVRGTLLSFEHMGTKTGGGGGVVVNTGSILGLQALAGGPVYTGTKHFVVSFGRAFGTEFYYEKSGVRVVTICPGITETLLLEQVKGPEGFQGSDRYVYEQLKNMPIQPGIISYNGVQVFDLIDSAQCCRGTALEMSKVLKSKNVFVCGDFTEVTLSYLKLLLRHNVKRVTISNGDCEKFDGIRNVLNDPRIVYLPADVNKIADLEGVYKKIKDIDVVINSKEITLDSTARWEGEITAHINSMICNTLLAIKHAGKMNGGRGGVVVNAMHIAGGVGDAAPGIIQLLNDLDRSFRSPEYYDGTGVQILTMCSSSVGSDPEDPPGATSAGGEMLLGVLLEMKSSLPNIKENKGIDGEVVIELP